MNKFMPLVRMRKKYIIYSLWPSIKLYMYIYSACFLKKCIFNPIIT